MKIAPRVSERGGPSRGKGGSLRSKAETLQARPEQSGGLPERGEHFQSIIGKGCCHAGTPPVPERV